MTLKKLATQLTLITAIAALPNISAAAVPHAFSAGDPILSSEMNSNFSDLDSRATVSASDLSSQNTRLTAVESAQANAIDFSGYFPAFSTLGSPLNALVLVSDDGNGGKFYRVRGGYETNSEQININGVPTARSHIWRSVFVAENSGGNLTSISRNRESPDDIVAYFSSNQYTAKGDHTSFDPVTLVPTIDPDDFTETFTCGDDGVPAITVCQGIDRLNSDNSFYDSYQWSRRQAVFTGSYPINGLPFTNVKFESYGNGTFRIRAKGIGTIFNNSSSSPPDQIIYYQVNGMTGGSLVGTPFEPGVGLLDGLFF